MPVTQPNVVIDYFYGRISRDESESALNQQGCMDGLYLLRESVAVAGNYVLSICFQRKIHHYSIERQPDNSVMISDGRPFPGPVELIQHHSRFLDGFLVKPKIPCSRPIGIPPMAWPGVSMLELEQILLEESDAKVPSDRKLGFGPERQRLLSIISGKLHKEQPWFHGQIERDSADRTMALSGHVDGKFLVRQKDKNIKKSYVLSISFHSETKHYKIDRTVKDSVVKLAIEDGPTFQNLMDMIAHYHNKMDGLLCKLTTFCVKNGWRKKERKINANSNDPIYGAPVLDPAIPYEVISEINDPDEKQDDLSMATFQIEPTDTKIYDSVARTDDVFNLKISDLVLTSDLGNGNFGSVKLGTYRHKNKQIPVAVKTLKQSEGSTTAEEEMMREARLMSKLDNIYIVRMIGVCKSDQIMLVLELAALGPLNKYLKKNPQLPTKAILVLMQQVAAGMSYLESNAFVHRDLAARNVLLAKENHAKISDFGMSKALGIGNDYYKANQAGRWPLKWYAPECLYFYRFDLKSDVWSYGVTLWEAMSYGNKPYRAMKGAAILEMLDEGRRMEQPAKCPKPIYDIMLKCWQRKSEDRPTFHQLKQMMKQHL